MTRVGCEVPGRVCSERTPRCDRCLSIKYYCETTTMLSQCYCYRVATPPLRYRYLQPRHNHAVVTLPNLEGIVRPCRIIAVSHQFRLNLLRRVTSIVARNCAIAWRRLPSRRSGARLPGTLVLRAQSRGWRRQRRRVQMRRGGGTGRQAAAHRASAN